MRQGKKRYLGWLLLAAMMAVTGFVLFREQSLGALWASLKKVKLPFLLGGLGLMFGYVGCEALCTHQILRRLGHRTSLRRCLDYSFVGFYVSSITPSGFRRPASADILYEPGLYTSSSWDTEYAAGIGLLSDRHFNLGRGAWLFARRAGVFDGGMGLLLFYGVVTMALLTVGMGMVMFLPGLSRRACRGVLKLLARLRILKKPDVAQEKLERQLTQYAGGAACIKANPGLTLQVLALSLLRLGMLFSVTWMVYLAFGRSGYSWIQIAGLQALLTLAVSNLPLPGAVGPAEGVFVTAFTAVFGAGTVTPAMLVSRGISFYAFLIVSFLVSLAVHLRLRRQASERCLREMAVSQPGSRATAMRSYLRNLGQES